MITQSIERLQFLCETIPALLNKIDEKNFTTKPSPEKWSKKEIIGHLVDSATNNHHRFVRGQFEQIPKITYDQDKWNKHNFYQQMDSRLLIAFWTIYNKQLLALIKLIPKESLVNQVETGELGEKSKMSIGFLIEDYVEHLEHHLRQVVSY